MGFSAGSPVAREDTAPSKTEVPGLAVQCSRPLAGPRGGRGLAGLPERWGRAPAARMPSPPGPALPRRIPRRARAGRRNNGQPTAAGSPVPEAGRSPPLHRHRGKEAPARGTNEINGCHRLDPYCLPGPASPPSVAYLLGSSPHPII